MSAGSTINETVIIENPDSATTISVFVVDEFKPTDGSYIPKSQYEKESFFDKWIGPPVTLTLGAKTTYTHSFTISVPKDTVNGIYHGAIRFQEVPKTVAEGSIKITSNVGMRIKLTITGGVTNTNQALIENIAPVNSVQTQQIQPQNSSEPKKTDSQAETVIESPTPISVSQPSSSPSLSPINITPNTVVSEAQSPYVAPAKYDSWDPIKIFVFIIALSLILFLIARKM